jgi:hypothetical protein
MFITSKKPCKEKPLQLNCGEWTKHVKQPLNSIEIET